LGDAGAGLLDVTETALPLELTILAAPEQVREALKRLRGALEGAGWAGHELARVELVLAEALNNIAEHAYAGGPAGPVILRIAPEGAGLRAVLRDRGRPMPRGAPPEGTLPPSDVATRALPEGGFGWFLIRSQTDSLIYRRESGENRLELHFRPRAER